jgi:hypothetical protein
MKVVVTSNITKVSARYRRMSKNLPGVVNNAIRDLVATEAVPLFEATTRTWVNQPTFTPVQTARGWQVQVNPAEPYKFVDRGTRVRFAFMSKDWKSKTKPGVIASFKGAGRVLFISRKRPRPGIQARNFTDTITKRMQARAANKIRQALSDTSYGAGAGY